MTFLIAKVFRSTKYILSYQKKKQSCNGYTGKDIKTSPKEESDEEAKTKSAQNFSLLISHNWLVSWPISAIHSRPRRCCFNSTADETMGIHFLVVATDLARKFLLATISNNIFLKKEKQLTFTLVMLI